MAPATNVRIDRIRGITAAVQLPPVVPSTKTEPAATGTPAAPAGHKIALPFLSAVISVNGVKEGVNIKVDFPADAPLFHLVSLTKKTAKISVSGGSLANGSQTLTLRRTKPL